MAVLAEPNADARVVEALPWLVATFESQFDFGWMVRQAKLQNLQNRLGFLLQGAAAETPGGLAAAGELERAKTIYEAALKRSGRV